MFSNLIFFSKIVYNFSSIVLWQLQSTRCNTKPRTITVHDVYSYKVGLSFSRDHVDKINKTSRLANFVSNSMSTLLEIKKYTNK